MAQDQNVAPEHFYAQNEEEFPPTTIENGLSTDISLISEVERDNFVTNSRITDDNYADRAIRRVLQLRKQQEYTNNMYDIQRNQLDAYRYKEINRLMTNERYWVDQLELYFDSLKVKGILAENDKHINLPHGRLYTWKQQDKWDFDEVDAMALGAINADFVKVEMSIDKRECKNKLYYDGNKVVYTPTGEVIPGITVTPGGRKFYVGESSD